MSINQRNVKTAGVWLFLSVLLIPYFRRNPLVNLFPLVIKGEILRGINFNDISCSLGVDIKVKDAVEFFHQASNFGYHLTMVFGDSEEIKKWAN